MLNLINLPLNQGDDRAIHATLNGLAFVAFYLLRNKELEKVMRH